MQRHEGFRLGKMRGFKETRNLRESPDPRETHRGHISQKKEFGYGRWQKRRWIPYTCGSKWCRTGESSGHYHYAHGTVWSSAMGSASIVDTAGTFFAAESLKTFQDVLVLIIHCQNFPVVMFSLVSLLVLFVNAAQVIVG